MGNIKKEIISFIKTVLFSLFIVFIINTFLFKFVKVYGNSMYPTLIDGEYGISSILNFKTEGIERFDIVIIYIPEINEYLVKRVVGLPNETLSYKNNELYINGNLVDEPFLKNAYTNDIKEIFIEENEYYCLGDNREHSKDSRFYGSFDLTQIDSKDFYVVYPFEEIGRKVK